MTTAELIAALVSLVILGVVFGGLLLLVAYAMIRHEQAARERAMNPLQGGSALCPPPPEAELPEMVGFSVPAPYVAWVRYEAGYCNGQKCGIGAWEAIGTGDDPEILTEFARMKYVEQYWGLCIRPWGERP